jgi:hypothetical protein
MSEVRRVKRRQQGDRRKNLACPLKYSTGTKSFTTMSNLSTTGKKLLNTGG